MRFTEHGEFYGQPVWEWNLPAGYTCPGAKDCVSTVDPKTGKFDPKFKFRCYAAVAERYPGVREARWKNYRAVKDLGRREIAAALCVALPEKAGHVRIHGSGDFFKEEYFLAWLDVCRHYPKIHFWAFTKVPNLWVAHRERVPSNLILQASYGGRFDHLIEEHHLKFAKVFPTWKAARESGLPIDTDDYYARQGTQSFALVDNYAEELGYGDKVEEMVRRLAESPGRDEADLFRDLSPTPLQVARARSIAGKARS